MTAPLAILAFFAITAGWVGIPEQFPGLGGLLPNWFEEFVGSMLHFEHAAEGMHSLMPLFTSLVVALGGLLIGWLVYRNVRKISDPLEKTLGPVHTLLKNKYYVDQFYQLVFIRPATWLAEIFTYKWLDLGLIDGILHAIGRFGLWTGRLLRNVIDLPVVNGAGDAAANGTRSFGGFLRMRQAGRVQVYMVIAIGLLVAAGLLFYLLAGSI